MLAYVYDNLDLADNKSSSFEEFENISELYAEILYLSFSRILKQGIYKEYTEVSEDSSVIRGKLNLNETIKRKVFLKKQVHISYDVFSENNLLNQIIKTTLIKLIHNQNIQIHQKRKLRSLLFYLSQVDIIDLTLVRWRNIQWNRQNNYYRLANDICYLYFKQLILEDINDGESGVLHSMNTHHLFESFVRSLYERETSYSISSPHIYWIEDNGDLEFLPRMETDLVLKNDNKTIIIDTKFYNKSMSDFDNHNSGNLYQMFSYLKNYPQSENLAGIILYAKTTLNELDNKTYSMQGNKLAVKSIDLDQDFDYIKSDLLKLAQRMFAKI